VKRFAVTVLVAIALTIAALAWLHKTTRLVRVGGMGNACTCTRRIEP
jgi:hypothetical protein